jgi:diguanylate cyclase (GGDEF)-like protein/PAS domain S-box-containing protein
MSMDTDQLDALREAEERFRLAFEHAPIGISLVAPDGRFMRVNRALCELTGYAQDELVGKTFQEITHPEDLDLDLQLVAQVLAGERRTFEMVKRYFHADGHIVWVQLNVSLVRDSAGEPLYFISQIQDISERRQLEEQLMFLAGHDEMTGLLNRRRFREELERGVAYAHRYRHSGALLLLDLDNFKQVNDTLGHHVGDILVTEVAARLRERLRATDVLARVGGDEFAVFLPQATPAQAQRVAGELVEHIAGQPFLTDEATVETRASLGVALFEPGEEPSDPEALLMHADLAMYDAKQAGGNRFTVVRAVGRPNPGDSTGSETGLNR